MGVRTVFLIRHGEYRKRGEWGELGPPLTARGRKQARRTAKELEKYDVDCIHASSLLRTQQTAEEIADVLGVTQVRYHKMLWEGYPTPIPGQKYEPEVRDHIRKQGKRIDNAFARFFRPSEKDSVEVIVAHGNVIRYFALRAVGARANRWFFMGTHCAGITRVVVVPTGEMILVSFNEFSHLPKNLRTLL